MNIIAISPNIPLSGEAELINELLDNGVLRYHIHKFNSTEQSIAEILEGVAPSNLRQISIHSHFHLVLAYGVGGIHYSASLKKKLKDDLASKVKLYQGFGIKVSVDIAHQYEMFEPADYAFLRSDTLRESLSSDIYLLNPELLDNKHQYESVAFEISEWNLDDPINTFNLLKSKIESK